MIIVSNATPLIGLAKIGRFHLLQQLFVQLHIADAVYTETVTNGVSAKQFVAQADWIRMHTVEDKLAVRLLRPELDLGEAETIVLANQLSAQLVLMDEKKGRRKVAQLAIPLVGTAGILLRAKQKGLITEVKPELYHLRQTGFSLSNYVINQILAIADEK